ncbi:cytochrome c biogenesis protein CcdA [Fluviicola sp.]|uniref:protein-disulfide reductase DsbD family protein n=1 Tax=Fluviicola sp. TaxID=1917219 RepID=UPI003D2BCAC4
MKSLFKSLILLVGLSATTNLTAQVDLSQDKAKWKISVEQGKNCEATIVADIAIEPHWHMNAMVLPKGSFGLATEFKFVPSKDYKLIGAPSEPKPILEHDETADEDLAFHEGRIKLKQKIKILSNKDFTIKGSYFFTTCNDNGCLPPYDGKINLKIKGCEDKTAEMEGTNDNPSQTATIQASNDDNKIDDSNTSAKTDKEDKTLVSDKKESKKQSLWVVFIGAFFSGFIALIMPCVFPMIPMTVSFFTKRSKTRAQGIKNSFLYGGSIILIHVLLGAIVAGTGTADLLNKWSTSAYFNIFFFLMLFVFGLSFLGGFEIQLPAKWVNKADEKADKGGVVGIFFMALVLSLASFSCTGPILGGLLGNLSANGGGTALMVGMFAFGFALALPFMLFAIFPSLLNSMPNSGGWLNVVKVFLGFIEIAFAFKFLGAADTTMQWHLLHREVFVAIWIGIFATLSLYMLGKIRLPHDSPVDKLSVGRAMMATTVIAFTMYLIPGLWGAPLNLVNAYLPPDFYAEVPGGLSNNDSSNTISVTGSTDPKDSTKVSIEVVDGMHKGPQNIMAFKDYDKALAYAKKVNKPLFIDFTGWGCVNCRKMENSVWGQPGIIEHLRNDVVIVSLYVDERTELPKKEQKTIQVNGQDFSVVTVGNKWTAKQIEEYKTSSQPYYILQTPEGKDIPVGSADYQNHGNPAVFKKWLEKGLEMHKK